MWLVFWRAFRSVQLADHDSIADTGLCLSDFAVLEVLLHKGPTPVNTIGQKVMLTSGSMTTAVNRLLKRELVVRRQDENDRRIFFVELTSEGEKLITSAFSEHANRLEELFSCFSEDERSSFLHLARKLGKSATTNSADS
ncbi:UNVERIFIED_CONTAM: hypothetical protein GTU68_023728 [Idotea baltica]|nr:hypothetical protein [Idotea baltica]